MVYKSFEEALQICMQAEEGSPEQASALSHCLKTAPPDLKMMLAQRLGLTDTAGDHHHRHDCGCGCEGKE